MGATGNSAAKALCSIIGDDSAANIGLAHIFNEQTATAPGKTCLCCIFNNSASINLCVSLTAAVVAASQENTAPFPLIGYIVGNSAPIHGESATAVDEDAAAGIGFIVVDCATIQS